MVYQRVLAIGAVAGVVLAASPSPQAVGVESPVGAAMTRQRAAIDQYCVPCHNKRLKTAGLELDSLDLSHVGEQPDLWEGVLRKLRAGVMPPAGRQRPPAPAYAELKGWIEGELDRAAAERPNPGRTSPFHRINQAEYRYVVRDLLDVDVDTATLLPADDASYGFDNIAGVLKVSESLMERYLSAARLVSTLAVGTTPDARSETFRVARDLPQDGHIEGLPLGTRGGALFHFTAPVDAEYVIRIELSNTVIDVNGNSFAQQTYNSLDRLGVMIDGAPAHVFEVTQRYMSMRLPIAAGSREIGLTFVGGSSTSVETETPRLGYANPVSTAPRLPFLENVKIEGPFNATGPGDTPSRRRVLICQPGASTPADTCAMRVVSQLARRAYRRPVSDEDVAPLLAFYRDGQRDGGFEAGIELAIRALLVSPEFLFRVEQDPSRISPDTNYQVSDIELASRLSFFLWSSIPDEELLAVATRGQLRRPATLEHQVRRMLADTRSRRFMANFGGQWLQLRNIAASRPSRSLFPDFDESLRQGFRQETELFLESILEENRSVLDLLTADYTFLNERLADHYGIPNIKGTHFRRVTLVDDRRRGLLGQGSILTVTSYPSRTSPVARGKWILTNILGAPPPAPPANVPPLPDKPGPKAGTMRERMAEHRQNPVCASCHSTIDPAGFALEQFDATGRWRPLDASYAPLDVSGTLPDGTKFDGVSGLRQALLGHPDRFITTVTEKLLTYALGRGVEAYDGPAVRRIVRNAGLQDFHFQSLILEIVRSVPFQMRRTGSMSDVVAHNQ